MVQRLTGRRRRGTVLPLVAISLVGQPWTVAQAQSSSPAARTCTIRTWHREVHHEAGFTLTLDLTGGFTPAGAWCKTVSATATLHAAKKLKGELTVLLFRASEPTPVSSSGPRKPVPTGGGGSGKVDGRTYQESTPLVHDSYGWYWARAIFIPEGGGRHQIASTIHSCQATTGRCAPVT